MKYLFGISFFIIALSLAYYLVIYIPNKDKLEQDKQNIYNLHHQQDLRECTNKVAKLDNLPLNQIQNTIDYCMELKGYSK